MGRFQYLVQMVPHEELQNFLTAAGIDGWELIVCEPCGKRPGIATPNGQTVQIARYCVLKRAVPGWIPVQVSQEAPVPQPIAP